MRLSTAVAAGLGSVLLVAAVAAGADSPTFGVNAQRTRVVQDTTYSATTDYPNINPTTVLAPSIVRAANSDGQVDSDSTPAVYSNVAYQYAYNPDETASTPRNSSTQAFLYALDLTTMKNAWSGSAWAFNASDQTCGSTAKGGQTTTPNLASVSSPTIAPGPGGQAYLAIGTGCYLYYAPLSSVTPSGSDQLTAASNSPLWSHIKIQGVSEPACTVSDASNCHQQIDMAPIITPAVSVPYAVTGQSGLSLPVTTPIACVGAWNQGVACQALAQGPAGTTQPAPVQWTIPQDGTYTNGGAAILTSSPAWDPQASVSGSNGAIVFGIDDGTQPGAVVFLDPATGAYKIVGLPSEAGVSSAGVSSSPAVYEYSPGAVPDGTVYTPDNYGDLYQIAPPGTASGGAAGQVTNYMANRDMAQACAASPWDISDLALGKENVYAIERCLSGAYEFTASNLAKEGEFQTLNGLTNAFSPTVVRNANDPNAAFMFVNSASTSAGQGGLLYLYNVGQDSSPQAAVQAMLLDTGAPGFVAPVADAGDQQALLLWTNSDGGGFNYWIPGQTPTNVTLSGPTSVQSGQSVTYTVTANAPALGPCDTGVASTCTSLLSNGGQLAVNDPGGGVSLQNETMASTTWTAPTTFNVTKTTTFALQATMQSSADYLPAQPTYQSNTLDVTVSPAPGTEPPPTVCTPEGTGWNQPANCNGPDPKPQPGPLVGTLLMAVDTADSYSPTHPPADQATPTPFYQNQWGLFGQHLWVEVQPPPDVPSPATLSSPPPSSYVPGVCQIQFPTSDQDFVTVPPGISDVTGQPWPQEWDALSTAPPTGMPTSLPGSMPAPGQALWSTILVDWSWWPPLPYGTVTGPPTNPWYVKSYFVARVWRWTYSEQTSTTVAGGKTTTTHKWVPSCTYQGEQGGTTNPQLDDAQGGEVFVWGDRIADVPVTTQEDQWGLP